MENNVQALEFDLVKQDICRYASFSLGAAQIRQAGMIDSPLYLKRELRRVEEALHACVRYGKMPFGGIRDIQESVEAAEKGYLLTCQEYREIAETIRGCVGISQYLQQFPKDEVIELNELVSSLSLNVKLASEIERCISINYEVYDHASPQLAGIRRKIRQIESDCSASVAQFIQNNASKLMDTITTQRNDRVCVLVKISEKNSIKGFIHGESASGATAYVEPECLIVLNNKLSSAKSEEQNEIKRILQQLSILVKAEAAALLGNCETLGILDSLFARGEWAKVNHGCVAVLNEQRQLVLKNARHPLIDPQKVVSNTYRLNTPKRMMLITGSNTGGKTVTLKTIGLFALMSMSGFPILCDEAQLPIFDHIFVDIGDEQSIEQSLSTFSAHLSKLARICDEASEHSLVLMDELGSGTDPKEGEALALAILQHLKDLKSTCIATTHYSALKIECAKWDEVLLSSVEFDVENLRPTYRFIEGLSGSSYAFEIARKFGLSSSILKEAMQFKENVKSNEEKMIEKVDELLNENYQLKEKLLAERSQLEEERTKFMLQREKFEKERQKVYEQAQQKAEQIILEAQEEAESVIRELKALGSDAKNHELLQVKKKLVVKEVEQPPISDDYEYSVGDHVKLVKYNYIGVIEEINGNQLQVLANGIKMKVKKSDCLPVQKPKQKKQKVSYTKTLRSAFSMECNVIGERVNDALAIIDKYLDNAILANVSVVRLVHGVGTGALRNAIHTYLKKHPKVAEFRLGGQGEGGMGATVVTLKMKK